MSVPSRSSRSMMNATSSSDKFKRPPREHDGRNDGKRRRRSPARRPSVKRYRSRSRSPPRRRRDSSEPRRPEKKDVQKLPEISEKDLEGKTEEEQEMMKIMGFAYFDSTKGKHVPGNNVGAVHVVQKRKYRQYMNRKGGFNRPLDFVA